MSPRLHYIDNLRVLVNFLIVINHSLQNPYLTENIANGNLPAAEVLRDFSAQLAPVRVPFFFFIAAVFTVTYIRALGLPAFIRTRIARVLFPFVVAVFTYVYVVVAIINYGDPDALFDLSAYVRYIREGFHGFSYLWFLYVLILFTAIMVLLLLTAGESRWGQRVPDRVRTVLTGKYTFLGVFLVLEGGRFVVMNLFAIDRSSSLPFLPVFQLVRDSGYFLAGLLFGLCLDKQKYLLGFKRREIMFLMVLYASLGLAGHVGGWAPAFLAYSLLSNFIPLLLLLVLFYQYLNRYSRLPAFIVGNTYTIYLIHFPLLCLAAWFLGSLLQLPAGFVYAATLLLVYPLSLGMAVLIRSHRLSAFIFGAKPLLSHP